MERDLKTKKDLKQFMVKLQSASTFLLFIWLLLSLFLVFGCSGSDSKNNLSDDELESEVYEDEPQNMIFVEGGSFQMGGSGYDDAKPIHKVIVSSFYIDKYEVTQKEWQGVMGSNPSKHNGDNKPVDSVTWYDVVEFCNKLSKKEGLTPAYTIKGSKVSCNWSVNGYRLPTEAEWEYAAKGGKKSQGFTYSGSNYIGSVAWYNLGYFGEPNTVGAKDPNELGIFDMSGNVWEWCWDWSGIYASSSQTNPKGANRGC